MCEVYQVTQDYRTLQVQLKGLQAQLKTLRANVAQVKDRLSGQARGPYQPVAVPIARGWEFYYPEPESTSRCAIA